MALLPLVCLSLLTWSLTTFGDEHGPSVINMVVKEDSDAILPCSLSTTSIKQSLFDWKKDGQKEVFMYDAGINHTGQDKDFKTRVSHFPEQLEFGNASIMIKNTKVTDRGNYTCDFPRLQPKRRSNIALVVDPIFKDRTAENKTGAAPEPSVTILDETRNWALLRCAVRGVFPKPELNWQDRAGNVVPAEETQVSEGGRRFYFTLHATVTKNGHYRCVATQKEIYHQIYAEIFVLLSGASPKPQVTILGRNEDGMLLLCEVRAGFPKPKLHWQDRAGEILQANEPLEEKRGGSYSIMLKITVYKNNYYRCVVTQEEISHVTYTETYVYNGVSIGWITGALLAFCFLILAGLLFFNVFYNDEEEEKEEEEDALCSSQICPPLFPQGPVRI